MNTRHLISLSAATGALIAASPALAQSSDMPEMTYEERAIVQSLPAVADAPEPYVYADEYDEEQEVEIVERHPKGGHGKKHKLRPMEPSGHGGMMHHAAPEMVYPAHTGHTGTVPLILPQGGYPIGAHPGALPHQPAQYDREAWLDQCRAQYGNGGKGKKRGAAIGGILGAVGGGLIGRTIDTRGNRVLGTVAGAGVGAAVGALAGSEIGKASDRRNSMDECEAYLYQYEHSYSQRGSYGYGPVMLVPVMVPVEQHAVVREYVSHEWVEETVHVRAPAKRVIYRAPATKTVKTQSVKAQPVKTRAVKSTKSK